MPVTSVIVPKPEVKQIAGRAGAEILQLQSISSRIDSSPLYHFIRNSILSAPDSINKIVEGLENEKANRRELGAFLNNTVGLDIDPSSLERLSYVYSFVNIVWSPCAINVALNSGISAEHTKEWIADNVHGVVASLECWHINLAAELHADLMAQQKVLRVLGYDDKQIRMLSAKWLKSYIETARNTESKLFEQVIEFGRKIVFH